MYLRIFATKVLVMRSTSCLWGEGCLEDRGGRELSLCLKVFWILRYAQYYLLNK